MIAIQLLINALIAGAIYSLVSVGFSLIYATNKFLHFAHGAVVTAGAYVFFSLVTNFNFPLWGALGGSIVFAGFLGVIMYYGVYNFLKKRKASPVIMLIAGLGLMILLENIIRLIFGSGVNTIDTFGWWREGKIIGGAFITRWQIATIIVALSIFAALWWFMNYTKFGTVIRAVSDHAELSAITGIAVVRVQVWGMIIGSALAGLVGALVGFEQTVEPSMGVMLVIKGFTGAIVGGVGSIPGAILGSFLVGFVENFGIWYLPSGYKDAIAFVLLLVFLLIRPQGILGINKGIKQ